MCFECTSASFVNLGKVLKVATLVAGKANEANLVGFGVSFVFVLLTGIWLQSS